MEKLRIYQPRVNSHIFSSNAHPDNIQAENNETKVWNSQNSNQ